MILLYILGPINQVLSNIPNIIQMQKARNRMNKFIEDIPSRGDVPIEEGNLKIESIFQSIETRNLVFDYENSEIENSFLVGLINSKVNSGEAIL